MVEQLSKTKKNKNTKVWRIRSMFIKELQLIQNDRFALLLVFVLPTMIMGTMYLAINQGQFDTTTPSGKNADALTIGVVDEDPTNTFPNEDLSHNFTLYLENSSDIIVTLYDNEKDALNALYYDAVDAYRMWDWLSRGPALKLPLLR